MTDDINIRDFWGVLFDLGGTLITYINNPNEHHFSEFKKHLNPGDPPITYFDFCSMIDRQLA